MHSNPVILNLLKEKRTKKYRWHSQIIKPLLRFHILQNNFIYDEILLNILCNTVILRLL